jgi:ABC-type branched-subunit amino acid transport system ATPase component
MVEALVNVLKAEHRRPVATLLVEQNVAFAFSLAGLCAVRKRGEIVARGSVPDQNAPCSGGGASPCLKPALAG